MPIEIETLEKVPQEVLSMREGSQAFRVLQFLATHQDFAFKPAEISDATGVEQGNVSVVLTRLKDRDLVRHRGHYWTLGADDRVASYMAQSQASAASGNDDGFVGEFSDVEIDAWMDTAVEPIEGYDDNGADDDHETETEQASEAEAESETELDAQ